MDGPGCQVLYAKKLSAADGFTARTVRLPRSEARKILPVIQGPELKNRTSAVTVVADETGRTWDLMVTCAGGSYILSKIGLFFHAHNLRPGHILIFWHDAAGRLRVSTRRHLPPNIRLGASPALQAMRPGMPRRTLQAVPLTSTRSTQHASQSGATASTIRATGGAVVGAGPSSIAAAAAAMLQARMATAGSQGPHPGSCSQGSELQAAPGYPHFGSSAAHQQLALQLGVRQGLARSVQGHRAGSSWVAGVAAWGCEELDEEEDEGEWEEVPEMSDPCCDGCCARVLGDTKGEGNAQAAALLEVGDLGTIDEEEEEEEGDAGPCSQPKPPRSNPTAVPHLHVGLVAGGWGAAGLQAGLGMQQGSGGGHVATLPQSMQAREGAPWLGQHTQPTTCALSSSGSAACEQGMQPMDVSPAKQQGLTHGCAWPNSTGAAAPASAATPRFDGLPAAAATHPHSVGVGHCSAAGAAAPAAGGFHAQTASLLQAHQQPAITPLPPVTQPPAVNLSTVLDVLRALDGGSTTGSTACSTAGSTAGGSTAGGGVGGPLVSAGNTLPLLSNNMQGDHERRVSEHGGSSPPGAHITSNHSSGSDPSATAATATATAAPAAAPLPPQSLSQCPKRTALQDMTNIPLSSPCDGAAGGTGKGGAQQCSKPPKPLLLLPCCSPLRLEGSRGGVAGAGGSPTVHSGAAGSNETREGVQPGSWERVGHVWKPLVSTASTSTASASAASSAGAGVWEVLPRPGSSAGAGAWDPRISVGSVGGAADAPPSIFCAGTSLSALYDVENRPQGASTMQQQQNPQQQGGSWGINGNGFGGTGCVGSCSSAASHKPQTLSTWISAATGPRGTGSPPAAAATWKLGVSGGGVGKAVPRHRLSRCSLPFPPLNLPLGRPGSSLLHGAPATHGALLLHAPRPVTPTKGGRLTPASPGRARCVPTTSPVGSRQQ